MPPPKRSRPWKSGKLHRLESQVASSMFGSHHEEHRTLSVQHVQGTLGSKDRAKFDTLANEIGIASALSLMHYSELQRGKVDWKRVEEEADAIRRKIGQPRKRRGHDYLQGLD